MRKIPLNEFISLRADNRFETARKNFVIELNAVLDSYDKNVLDIDLNDVMECRREMYGLIREKKRMKTLINMSKIIGNK